MEVADISKNKRFVGKLLCVGLGLWLIFPLTISAQEQKNHTINVILETIFEDGEKAVEQRVEEVMAMEDFWAKYHAWQLVDMSQNQVKFRSQVETISPLMTLSGYSTIAP